MRDLITSHPIALGLLAGAALIALFSPAEAGGRSGRADGFSQHEIHGLSGTVTGTVLTNFVRQHAWNNGSTRRTGDGSRIVYERRQFFDVRTQTPYMLIVPKIEYYDHDYDGPQMKPPSNGGSLRTKPPSTYTTIRDGNRVTVRS